MALIDLVYPCPACGNKSLHVYPESGMIQCLNPRCSDPSAISKVLLTDLGPYKHVVKLGKRFWSAEHPLHERVDGRLHQCGVERIVDYMRSCSVIEGTYIVHIQEGVQATWEELGKLVHEAAELNTSESIHGE